jgi:hypothetical protein
MAIFGKPPIDPATLASEIVSGLRREESLDGRRWNTKVKEVVRARVDRKRYLVHPDPEKKECGREWLNDVVWFARAESSIHLAVEVELRRKGDVLCDLQKLLCIKAPLKVMVYRDRDGKGSIVRSIEAYMEEFDQHVRGEHYLLVEMAPSPPDRAYLYKVRQDGRQTSIRFSPLNLRTATAA